MYDWKELIELWEHERLTQEQVIGQLLKYGEQFHRHEVELRRRLEQVEQTVATLLARDQAAPSPHPPKPK
ncbi:MAG: hypothetical protein U0350_44080 [Caldilineaceae bacterium]